MTTSRLNTDLRPLGAAFARLAVLQQVENNINIGLLGNKQGYLEWDEYQQLLDLKFPQPMRYADG